MKPTISAFYQCYKQPKAFLRALTSFREYYPESTISLVSDGDGHNYMHAAAYFNCQYGRLPKKTGHSESTLFSSREELLNWIGRLVDTAKISNEDYILLLEDDVVVLQPIATPLLYDINGANVKEFLGQKIQAYLHQQGKKAPLKNGKFYYGGCGGSLFKKSFLLEHFSDREALESIIASIEPYREGRHEKIYSTDYWISILTYYVGGTIGTYKGFCETWYPSFWFRKNIIKNIEVLHQAKDFYNKPLTKNEEGILGEFIV